MLEKVNEILDLWFGTDTNNLLAHQQLWFKQDAEFDALIRSKFEGVHQLAVAGQLDLWTNQPQSCLAFIILLDQFSRNIYRGDAKAFAQDHLALQASEKGRDHKLDKELSVVHRLFFYMPLMHSEDIEDQQLCLALSQHLIDDAREQAPNYLSLMESSYHYAQRHYDIIHQFGRFPHRNTILGRDSTQEELVFLGQKGSTF